MADQQQNDPRSGIQAKPGTQGNPGTPSRDTDRNDTGGKRPDMNDPSSRQADQQKATRQGADPAVSGGNEKPGDAQRGDMTIKGNRSDDRRRDPAE